MLAAADDAALGETALAIGTAWYTGTVSHGTHAVMVAYASVGNTTLSMAALAIKTADSIPVSFKG